jgi:hypothetical protein
MLGAMDATEDRVAVLHAMPDNPYRWADRRERLDCALK